MPIFNFDLILHVRPDASCPQRKRQQDCSKSFFSEGRMIPESTVRGMKFNYLCELESGKETRWKLYTQLPYQLRSRPLKLAW